MLYIVNLYHTFWSSLCTALNRRGLLERQVIESSNVYTVLEAPEGDQTFAIPGQIEGDGNLACAVESGARRSANLARVWECGEHGRAESCIGHFRAPRSTNLFNVSIRIASTMHIHCLLWNKFPLARPQQAARINTYLFKFGVSIGLVHSAVV